MEGYNAKQEIFNLTIDEEARGQLLETARWTKFLAILGYVILGLLVLFGIAMGAGLSMLGDMSSLSDTPMPGGFGIGMMLIYIVLALLYFFPTYYLYKYSVLIRPSLLNNNQEQFNLALSYQRRMFKFVGILMIVVLALYALVFIFAIIGAAVAGM